MQEVTFTVTAVEVASNKGKDYDVASKDIPEFISRPGLKPVWFKIRHRNSSITSIGDMEQFLAQYPQFA